MERTEAIEVIRKCWPVNRNGMLSDALKTLIPELEESEDEKIKSALLRGFNSMMANRSIKTFGGEPIRSILSYLEKQKEQKPAEWKPLPESMEALLLAIEGKWDAIKPTGYMSRRLEDLYDGLVNTFDVDEKYLSNLPKTEYTEKDIEEIKALKEKIDSSMETKPAEWSEEDEAKITFLERLIRYNVPEGQYGWVDGHKGGFVTKLEAISILKSIRPSWKPSKEQMEILGRFNDPVLKSLYSDLQKLL